MEHDSWLNSRISQSQIWMLFTASRTSSRHILLLYELTDTRRAIHLFITHLTPHCLSHRSAPSADSNARIKERPRFTLECFMIFKPRCDTSHIKKTATLVAHRAYCPLKMSNLRHNTINMLACAIFSQTNPVFKFT